MSPMGLKNPTVVASGNSAFNFAAASIINNPAFYDKDAAATIAFLDDCRNPNLTRYYNMLRHQQQHQQQIQQGSSPIANAAQQACNKLSNQTARNYSTHPFLHSTQRPTAYAPVVLPYVSPHGTNIGINPATYQSLSSKSI